jgi:peptidoglycan/LPS O-acetylase OafA/YrhL
LSTFPVVRDRKVDNLISFGLIYAQRAPITFIFIIKRRRPLVWIYAGILAMMATRLAFIENAAQLTFAPYARPVGLLVGCALAFVPVSAGPRLPRVATLSAGAALLALGAIYTGYDGMLAVFFPLLGSIAAAIIIVACIQGGARIIGAAPISYVGRISYGLYLYGFPLAVIGEHWKLPLPPTVSTIGLVALSFAAAALSYEFVEKPCLRLKDRLGERRGLPVAVAAE